MNQIQYKPSYLEEIVFFEVVNENCLAQKFHITTAEELTQFLEAAYWGAISRFISCYCDKNTDRSANLWEKMCAEVDKLCDLTGLHDYRKELVGWLQCVERHTFELYRRIRNDIRTCEDEREWLCQLRPLLAYVTKTGPEYTYSKNFLRFLKSIQTIIPDDVVFKALLDLQERRLNVKVLLSGE